LWCYNIRSSQRLPLSGLFLTTFDLHHELVIWRKEKRLWQR
jgi:hypothetical protein